MLMTEKSDSCNSVPNPIESRVLPKKGLKKATFGFSKLFSIGAGFGLVLIFNSCSCNWHLEKARSKCGSTIIKDTLTIHDTLITESVTRDTIFNFNQSDTVILKEGKLTVKYFYHDSLVYLQGKCDSDTIYKVIKVPYEKIELNFSWYDWFKKNLLLIVVICLILGVGYLIFKHQYR